MLCGHFSEGKKSVNNFIYGNDYLQLTSVGMVIRPFLSSHGYCSALWAIDYSLGKTLQILTELQLNGLVSYLEPK